MGIELR